METTPAFDRAGFKNECTRRRSAGLMVSGNTYWHRDALKAMGGIWDAVAKGWLMPSQEAYENGMSLVKGRAKGYKSPAKKYAPQVAETETAVEFEMTPVPAASPAAECGDMPF